MKIKRAKPIKRSGLVCAKAKETLRSGGSIVKPCACGELLVISESGQQRLKQYARLVPMCIDCYMKQAEPGDVLYGSKHGDPRLEILDAERTVVEITVTKVS